MPHFHRDANSRRVGSSFFVLRGRPFDGRGASPVRPRPSAPAHLPQLCWPGSVGLALRDWCCGGRGYVLVGGSRSSRAGRKVPIKGCRSKGPGRLMQVAKPEPASTGSVEARRQSRLSPRGTAALQTAFGRCVEYERLRAISHGDARSFQHCRPVSSPHRRSTT